MTSKKKIDSCDVERFSDTDLNSASEYINAMMFAESKGYCISEFTDRVSFRRKMQKAIKLRDNGGADREQLLQDAIKMLKSDELSLIYTQEEIDLICSKNRDEVKMKKLQKKSDMRQVVRRFDNAKSEIFKTARYAKARRLGVRVTTLKNEADIFDYGLGFEV